MDFSYTAEDDAFRAELRQWLDANLPEFMASGEIGDENNPDRRTMLRRQAWQRCLHGGRWAAINWPKSWGGREATVMQNTIYSEEMARAKTPGIYNANGLWQIGQLIAAEAMMVNTSAGKTIIELPAGFAERYTKETSSIDDPAKLGNKKDLMALFDKVREKTCAWAATLTPADMAKPTPEKMRQFVPTVGHLANMIPVHVAMHIGQIQVLRRKLGKPILF